MSNSRIHRYILREISAPTILSLLIFTFVLLMGRIPRLTELVINKGVPALEIVRLFSYLMPTFFSITIPLSFLLGILLAFGRFSADSEFIALKASGVSLYNLVKPVFILAVLFTILTAWLTTSIIPASKTAFKSKLFQIASSSINASIRPGVFNGDFEGIVLYVRGMDEQSGIMRDVFISDEREGEIPAIIVARKGRFISDPNQYTITLRLSDGSIHRRPPKGDRATYQTINFNKYDINLNTGGRADKNKRHRSHSELSWSELDQAIKKKQNTKKVYSLLAEKHKRIVIAFAPLVLVLVGVPLGLQSQRSGKGSGFSLALLVFLVYYVLLSLAGNIAENGILPAAVILWLPNFCFLVGGSWFLHCTAIERPVQFFKSPYQVLRNWFSSRPKNGGSR
jgi:lipopolysaccharide export system permease protein